MMEVDTVGQLREWDAGSLMSCVGKDPVHRSELHTFDQDLLFAEMTLCHCVRDRTTSHTHTQTRMRETKSKVNLTKCPEPASWLAFFG